MYSVGFLVRRGSSMIFCIGIMWGGPGIGGRGMKCIGGGMNIGGRNCCCASVGGASAAYDILL